MHKGGSQHACYCPADQHRPANGATTPEARGLTLPQPFNLLSEVRAPCITSPALSCLLTCFGRAPSTGAQPSSRPRPSVCLSKSSPAANRLHVPLLQAFCPHGYVCLSSTATTKPCQKPTCLLCIKELPLRGSLRGGTERPEMTIQLVVWLLGCWLTALSSAQ